LEKVSPCQTVKQLRKSCISALSQMSIKSISASIHTDRIEITCGLMFGSRGPSK
jgi:hypothetical protein